jgi:hypothetical protein
MSWVENPKSFSRCIEVRSAMRDRSEGFLIVGYFHSPTMARITGEP